MKIRYFPAGDRAFASSRLRVYRIADALAAQGQRISFDNDPFENDVVVFQKRFELPMLMHQLRQRNIRVVLDVDDWIPNVPVEYADVVTVDTAAKRALYPGAVIVPDALDVDEPHPYKVEHRDRFTQAVWIGNAENVYHIDHAARACQRVGILLVAITDLSKVDVSAYPNTLGVRWRLESIDSLMTQCDVFLAPFVFEGRWSQEWVASKSANRIQKAWALGLPVAATPIPSYVDAGLRYAAATVEEWVQALTELQTHEARWQDAARGCPRVQAVRAEAVAEQWLRIFEGA